MSTNQINNGGLRCNNREVQEWRSEYRTSERKGNKGRRERGVGRRGERERTVRPPAPPPPPSVIYKRRQHRRRSRGEGGRTRQFIARRRGAAGPEQSRPGQPSLLCGVGARDGGLRRLRCVGRRRAHLLRRQGPYTTTTALLSDPLFLGYSGALVPSLSALTVLSF
jgi:hypothetical protein